MFKKLFNKLFNKNNGLKKYKIIRMYGEPKIGKWYSAHKEDCTENCD